MAGAKKLHKTTQNKAYVRRKKVEDGVIKGKSEKEIAAELGMSRDRVAQIKAEPEFQERIKARVEAAASLTDKEVIGTLAAQMRADITDLFTDENSFDIGQIKEKKLGHLIRKIKVRREYDGHGEEREPVDIIELELHNPQAAAIQLCKVLGIEKQPAVNDSDAAKWQSIADSIAKKYKKPVEEVKRDLVARKPELATYLIQ
jgi:hypothetical protein